MAEAQSKEEISTPPPYTWKTMGQWWKYQWEKELRPAGKKIKKWLKQAFNTDLNSVYKTPENEEEKKRIKKIRNINLIEFLLSLVGMFTVMWTLWWQGVRTDNSQLMNIAFVIIGLIGIWALLISPFFHYHLEKGIVYRKGYLGLDYEQNYWTAWFEERGLGSLKKHWTVTLKDKKLRKYVDYMTLFVLLTIVLVLFDSFGKAEDLAEAFGVKETPLKTYAAVTALTWLYQAIALFMLLFGFKEVLQWENTGDNDGLKKVLLIVPHAIMVFLGPFVYWGFGIRFDGDGNWTAIWADVATMNQMTCDSPSGKLFLVGIFTLFLVLWFLIKYVLIGILIRFDNLKTAVYQLIFVSIIAYVLIMIVWYILTLPFAQPYILSHNTSLMSHPPTVENMWYIFDSTAMECYNETTFASFIGNWAGYIYWGMAQEWLFLGYWCTLLTKISKNKYLNAFLSSLTFGAIHFPSWPLMIFTMVGGFFWGIAWQRNDSRNLYIMGMIHGFAGTLVAKFIPITMSVGPSNMG